MASFVFSQAINTLGSKVNVFHNTVNKLNSVEGTLSLFETNSKWKKDKVKGKLNELSVQTSTYNKIIPIVYGTVRLAGNIIWLGKIKEVKEESVNTVKVGKGKKVKQKNIMYYYFLSFAIAICKGEIAEIKNIWADTELLDLTNYKHRIYYGRETQLPDVLISSIEGIEKTCAYRDLCYIVFENFPLSDFGNRIPNFTFEIKRKSLFDYNDESLLENMVSGVNLIPGCGEFVYSNEIQYKVYNGKYLDFVIDGIGEKIRINQNNNEGKADCVVAIDQLQDALPKCQWVSPVVVWFGDNLAIEFCKIQPKIEYKRDSLGCIMQNEPFKWKVATYTRENAEMVSFDGENISYGGTPSDDSVVGLLEDLKKRNLKIMFNPMLFMDTKQKPWRGYLTGKTEAINDFYENQYEPFILHYANLTKNHINAFLIGSELKSLTAIKDENNNFPFVDKLIILAEKCRQILGEKIKISYAADWSEYHHTDNGWYNMDKLWANNNIDFVGVDAYFPLTDRAEQSNIDKDIIMKGWTSGEYYDYYYENNIKMNLKQEYAIKNIKFWWENKHINPDGLETLWQAKHKKIWFTEYGFASVDATTNEPSKFYDVNSMDGGFPKNSKGFCDFYAQRMALEATEEVWKNSDFVEQKFIWCWDARPYPYFPNRLDLWTDGGNWKFGHWLNGKVKLTQAKDLLKQLFIDAKINQNTISNIEINDVIDGFVINNNLTLNDALEMLKTVYFFDFIEQNGAVNIISNKNNVNRETTDIYENELTSFSTNGNEVFLEVINKNINELPKKVQFAFLDKNVGYDSNLVYSQRETEDTDFIELDTIPIVLDENKAKNITEINLYLKWLERNTFKFVLSPKYLFLEVSDLINLIIEKNSYLLKIKEITINENLTLTIIANLFDNSIYNTNNNTNNNEDSIVINKAVGETNYTIFEIPAISNDLLDKPTVFFTVNAVEAGWSGANIYYSENSDNYKFFDSSIENSIVGFLGNNLKNVKPYYFDYENNINIILHSKIDVDELNNITTTAILSKQNIALLGNECLQFETITLNENGSYTLKNILRGLFGTEKYMNNHQIGDKFILLNNNILQQITDINKLFFNNYYKVVSIGNDFLTTNAKAFTISGKNLTPLAPCHINYKINNNNLYLFWKRRDRGIQNWRDKLDNILIEKNENYYLEIRKNDILIHKNTINTNKYEFNLENITLPIKILLCQTNELVGNGEFTEINIDKK